MLLVDIILHAFVGYYLDQVIPKEVGVAQPWNFLCKKLKTKGSKLAEAKLNLQDELQANDKQDFFEEVSH